MVERLIALSCLAPSVGNSQPWRFVRVVEADSRVAVRANFVACNSEALDDYQGEQGQLYASLKLAGLDDAPEHLAVFSDRADCHRPWLGQQDHAGDERLFGGRRGLHLLAGRPYVRLGVGWVSILDPECVREILRGTARLALVAYLCIGQPVEESDEPELVRLGWQAARPRQVPVQETVIFLTLRRRFA